MAIFLGLEACSLPFNGRPVTGAYVISGTVRTGAGAPVIGATISIIGTNLSAVSDSSGAYRIESVPGISLTLEARAVGLACVPSFSQLSNEASPGVIKVDAAAVAGIVSSADFTAFSPDGVTIPVIQGKSMMSPLTGQEVRNVRGVVTMVTHKAAHGTYDTVQYDGSSLPQWISEDGFFMEAFGSDKDGDPLSSDGIFIATHDPRYLESRWRDGIASDIKPGDVVVVSGTVREQRPMDRFNSSTAYLTRTIIDALIAVPVTQSDGTRVTSTFPDGVLLTYEDTSAWAGGFRTMPWNDSGPGVLQRAIDVLESVEGMFIRINEPLVTGCTYYNVTGIMADGAKKAGSWSDSFNSEWRAPVLSKDDFNTELLYVDYQSPTWKTNTSMPQVGDILKDSADIEVFRGVMDYTADAIYMARPLQIAPTVLSNSGLTLPAQGWGFNNTYTWYGTTIQTALKTFATADRTTVADWRIGASANAKFKPSWTPAEADSVYIAAYNFENYVNQGKPNNKDVEIAKIVAHNLKSPDVLIVIEMGDDNATTPVYVNQADSWAYEDGVVSAVRNYRGVIAALKTQSGLDYDFRQIDPIERDSGGAPGNNIRVGFLFRTDRIQFVDRGLETNHMANTATLDSKGNLDDSTWPVKAPSSVADILANANTSIWVDDAGDPHLTQSPGFIQHSSFNRSRRPLAGEFKFKPTGATFFAVASHLSSKGGDMPLYGEIQPPILKSQAGRVLQAAAVNKFVSNILAADHNARVAVGGDMNDFGYSLPIQTLTGQVQGNRILYSPSEEFMPTNERFSYSFRGNLQQIDHILVSDYLFKAIETDGKADWRNVCFIAHINSMFSRNNKIPTSDHDPEIVRLKGGW